MKELHFKISQIPDFLTLYLDMHPSLSGSLGDDQGELFYPRLLPNAMSLAFAISSKVFFNSSCLRFYESSCQFCGMDLLQEYDPFEVVSQILLDER